MKLFSILEARKTIETVTQNTEMHAHLAYWFSKFMIKTQGEADFYIAELKKILEKYNAKVDEAEITIAAESKDDFNREVSELQNTDVETPDIRFSLDELSSEIKLSMAQIMPLMDFIDE